ncbi:MAG: sugar phosphate nucleotidyltransferase [Wenyingzhuangia sp.]|jgi:NDP-sugar pyrophosphorylase family protein
MNKYTLVVLAAGMGSRYGGLKQMDPMSDEGDTIIDFSIYDAIQAGFKKVVFIVREDFIADFRAIFDDKLSGKIEVEYVCQSISDIPLGYAINENRTKPWGTGHALLMTKGVVKDNFVVINGDDFYGKQAYKDIIKELSRLDKNSFDMCMVGYNIDKTISDNGYVSRGECFLDADHNLIDVIERTSIEKLDNKIVRKDDQGEFVPMIKGTVVSMNFWGFTPRFLEVLEEDFKSFMEERSEELKSEFFIPTVVSNVINAKRGVAKVLTTVAQWYGVTYAEDKSVVTAAIKEFKEKKVYPKKLWS